MHKGIHSCSSLNASKSLTDLGGITGSGLQFIQDLLSIFASLLCWLHALLAATLNGCGLQSSLFVQFSEPWKFLLFLSKLYLHNTRRTSCICVYLH